MLELGDTDQVIDYKHLIIYTHGQGWGKILKTKAL
jgi:hypothetical protein